MGCSRQSKLPSYLKRLIRSNTNTVKTSIIQAVIIITGNHHISYGTNRNREIALSKPQPNANTINRFKRGTNNNNIKVCYVYIGSVCDKAKPLYMDVCECCTLAIRRLSQRTNNDRAEKKRVSWGSVTHISSPWKTENCHSPHPPRHSRRFECGVHIEDQSMPFRVCCVVAR